MKLSAEPMDLFTKHVFGISRSTSQAFHNVLVTVEAGGREGLGEAAPAEFYGEDQASTLRAIGSMAKALEEELGPALLAGGTKGEGPGRAWSETRSTKSPGTGEPRRKGDAHQGDASEERGGRAAEERGAVAPGGFLPFHMQTILDIVGCVEGPCAAAMAAVDMALYDLLGSELDVPLWRMLGLDPSRTPITSFTIGLDKLDVMLEKVEEASDFPLLKIKLNTGADVHVIEAIRSRTSQRIRVDANCAWKPKEAVSVIKKLGDLGVEMIEQPVDRDDLEGLKYIKDNVDVPIYADESVMVASDIPRLAGVVDGINIKLMKCGGISEALRMIHTARAVGLKIMIGCMIESSIAITAAAHITPLVDAADLDGNLLLREDPFEGVKVKEGKLILPGGPGLGVRKR